ncbi:DUF3010 family protein [Pseudomonas sp. NPDC090755]|uniref:DUF3010 family protein n=1 Tax=Pseudomonas sp. NPDC090755 TaxID=3364481 RepID=UPI00383B77F9
MKICGIEIKGSEALCAVAMLDAGQPSHAQPSIKKLALDNDEDAAQVKAFAHGVQALLSEHGITALAIKKRSKKGEFAGGPLTFKIEAILQMLEGCEVHLLSPQTVSAQAKKHNLQMPGSLNKYQHEAYKTACALLLSRR